MKTSQSDDYRAKTFSSKQPVSVNVRLRKIKLTEKGCFVSIAFIQTKLSG